MTRRRKIKVAGRVYCPRCNAVYSILTDVEEAISCSEAFAAPLHVGTADSFGDCVRCGGEMEVLELSDELRAALRESDDDEPWKR